MQSRVWSFVGHFVIIKGSPFFSVYASCRTVYQSAHYTNNSVIFQIARLTHTVLPLFASCLCIRLCLNYNPASASDPPSLFTKLSLNVCRWRFNFQSMNSSLVSNSRRDDNKNKSSNISVMFNLPLIHMNANNVFCSLSYKTICSLNVSLKSCYFLF